ncbi:hypothetical protein ACFC0N_27645 [Streptomyces zaomyceticus]
MRSARTTARTRTAAAAALLTAALVLTGCAGSGDMGSDSKSDMGAAKPADEQAGAADGYSGPEKAPSEPSKAPAR